MAFSEICEEETNMLGCSLAGQTLYPTVASAKGLACETIWGAGGIVGRFAGNGGIVGRDLLVLVELFVDLLVLVELFVDLLVLVEFVDLHAWNCWYW